jgi:hypothetical protein
MTDNPLALRSAPQVRYDLDEFVYRTNQNWFVIQSGKPYFVNTQNRPDGSSVRFMDRHA